MTFRTGRRVGAVTRTGFLAGAMVALLTAAAVAPATATWTNSNARIPQVRNGSLAAESCPGTADCIAVGHADGPSGPARSLAEAWNGTAWRVLPTPDPAGSKGSNLDAVSCRAATACTAVGTYTGSAGTALPLAESWNGTTWRVQATPDQSSSHGTVLDGVSCTAANACTAVGYYENESSQFYPQALAESWNGHTWSLLPAPYTGAIESPLYGVSCTGPHFCIAVGSATNASGSNVSLAEAWNGTAWTILRTAHPTHNPVSSLNGISCTAGNACTAVGSFIRRGISGYHTLAETWNGSAWTLQQSPNPGGHTDILAAVSCTTASACTAVGSAGVDESAGLAEAWNGSAWTAQTTPVPAGALTGVSCVAGGCGAVGYAYTRSGATRAVALASTGATWALQSAANPLGAEYSFLAGVSCAGATSCVAVGTSTAQEWNGSQWRELPVAGPAGAASIDLADVSCATATACMAVGFYTTPAGRSGLLAESWNGTTWTIRPPASPSGGTGATLNGVSCAAAGACLAVGYYLNSLGNQQVLAESWNGTAWAVQTPAQPADSPVNELNGVSCTAADSCVAVGGYQLNRSGTVELAESWNGTTWSIQHTPGTNGTRILNSVSCTAPDACAAVGYVGGSALAETWNGTTWIARKPSSPPNSYDVFLNHVSCVTASDCTAVGDYSQINTGFGRTLAEVWNGTAWRRQQTAGPGNTDFADLTGISCSAGGACTAVGGYGPSETSLGVAVPLAEQRT